MRRLLALLLFIAAALKALYPSTTSHQGILGLPSHSLSSALIVFEFVLGSWLLTGWQRVSLWLATTVCFSVFAPIALGSGLRGSTSCGCFGRVAVSPWWTVAIDVAALVALTIWVPLPPRGHEHPPDSPSRPPTLRSLRITSLLLMILGVSLGAFVSPELFKAANRLIGSRKVVVLEPELWEGRAFPLLSNIDIGETLRRGRWTVLLYHHDCPKCQAIIRAYEIRQLPSADAAQWPIALIEVPPYGKAGYGKSDPSSPILRGRLDDDEDWFVTTPLLIRIDDGTVVAVVSEPTAL